jgi:hypothetical protein
MFKQILFLILFTISMAWSVSLQVVLQAVEDKKIRIRVITMVLVTTLIAGLCLSLV